LKEFQFCQRFHHPMVLFVSSQYDVLSRFVFFEICFAQQDIKLKVKRSEFNRFSTCIEAKTLYCYFISKLALSLWRNGTNERILFIVVRFNSIYLCNLNLNGNKACIFLLIDLFLNGVFFLWTEFSRESVLIRNGTFIMVIFDSRLFFACGNTASALTERSLSKQCGRS